MVDSWLEHHSRGFLSQGFEKKSGSRDQAAFNMLMSSLCHMMSVSCRSSIVLSLERHGRIASTTFGACDRAQALDTVTNFSTMIPRLQEVKLEDVGGSRRS